MAPSPPGHGNFDFQPIVYRGPYEYGSPEVDTDYYPQIQPPPARKPRRGTLECKHECQMTNVDRIRIRH